MEIKLFGDEAKRFQNGMSYVFVAKVSSIEGHTVTTLILEGTGFEA